MIIFLLNQNSKLHCCNFIIANGTRGNYKLEMLINFESDMLISYCVARQNENTMILDESIVRFSEVLPTINSLFLEEVLDFNAILLYIHNTLVLMTQDYNLVVCSIALIFPKKGHFEKALF